MMSYDAKLKKKLKSNLYIVLKKQYKTELFKDAWPMVEIMICTSVNVYLLTHAVHYIITDRL